MMLSGRLVDAFLALADTCHFALAAQRCHVSPSTFSQMIGRLEQQLGVRLFDRNTRRVALTAEGETFLRGAQRMSQDMDATLAELRDRSAGKLGRVAVAAPPSLCASWLPRQLAAFRADHAGIALGLHDAMSDRCLAMIASGDVDFGLNAQKGNDIEFEAHRLFHERMFLLCPADDPIAQQAEVRLRDLAQRDFVHTSRIGSVWQQLHPALAEVGVRDTDHQVSQLGSLAGLVANGFGITIVPELALPLCARPELCVRPIADRLAERPIYAVRRKQRSLSIAAAKVWDHLLGAAEPSRRRAPRAERRPRRTSPRGPTPSR